MFNVFPSVCRRILHSLSVYAVIVLVECNVSWDMRWCTPQGLLLEISTIYLVPIRLITCDVKCLRKVIGVTRL